MDRHAPREQRSALAARRGTAAVAADARVLPAQQPYREDDARAFLASPRLPASTQCAAPLAPSEQSLRLAVGALGSRGGQGNQTDGHAAVACDRPAAESRHRGSVLERPVTGAKKLTIE